MLVAPPMATTSTPSCARVAAAAAGERADHVLVTVDEHDRAQAPACTTACQRPGVHARTTGATPRAWTGKAHDFHTRRMWPLYGPAMSDTTVHERTVRDQRRRAARRRGRARDPRGPRHGFPELWYSWRHQIPALADGRLPRHRARPARLRPSRAGPRPSTDYDILHLTDDLLGLLDNLGEERRCSSATTGARWSCGRCRCCIPSASPAWSA